MIQTNNQQTKRSYPKNKKGQTHHWAAVVSHIDEYDKEMNKQNKLNKWNTAVFVSKELEKQMEFKKQKREELKIQDREMDKEMLEYNIGNGQDQRNSNIIERKVIFYL